MPDEFNPSTPLKNTRHEKVVQNILKGQNQTEAYINAGYTARGHSAETAAERLLRNDELKKRLAWLKEQSAEHAIVTKEEVLQELKNVAFSRQTDYASWGHKTISKDVLMAALEDEEETVLTDRFFAQLFELKIRDSSELTDQQVAAIQAIEVKRSFDKDGNLSNESIKLKLHPKNPALVKLGEHFALFKPEAEDDGGNELEAIRKALLE